MWSSTQIQGKVDSTDSRCQWCLQRQWMCAGIPNSPQSELMTACYKPYPLFLKTFSKQNGNIVRQFWANFHETSHIKNFSFILCSDQKYAQITVSSLYLKTTSDEDLTYIFLRNHNFSLNYSSFSNHPLDLILLFFSSQIKELRANKIIYIAFLLCR